MIEHMLEEDVQEAYEVVGNGGEANVEQILSKHVCCRVEILINANSVTSNLDMCNKLEDAHFDTHRRDSKNH